MPASAAAIRVRRHGARAEVTWERPPVNVLQAEDLHGLATALRSPHLFGANVVVLSGQGKGWSAGFDVEEHLEPDLPVMLDAMEDALHAIWEIPVPTIARVHGACLGGGLELAAACDLVVAGASARFGQPEIQLGVFPPFGAAYYPTVYGPQRAAELMFLGETIGAEAAARLGIVNRVFPDDGLDAGCDALAARLLSMHRPALVHLKAALRAGTPAPWPALAKARAVYEDVLMTEPGSEEGLRAFLEKRAPLWRKDAAAVVEGHA